MATFEIAPYRNFVTQYYRVFRVVGLNVWDTMLTSLTTTFYRHRHLQLPTIANVLFSTTTLTNRPRSTYGYTVHLIFLVNGVFFVSSLVYRGAKNCFFIYQKKICFFEIFNLWNNTMMIPSINWRTGGHGCASFPSSVTPAFNSRLLCNFSLLFLWRAYNYLRLIMQ